MKLFKKLKFLDFLLISVFMLAAVFLFQFFNPKEEWIDLSVYVTNIPVFQANSLSVGDVEKNPSGELIAQIERIETYSTQISPASSIITRDISVNKDVFVNVKILTKVNSRTGDFEYKNKPVKVGSQIEFRFNTGFISGKVVSFGNINEIEPEEKLITLVLYNQWSWFADSLKTDDVILDEDGDKEKIIAVISKTVNPTQVDPGQVGKVDIILKAKIKVQKFGDEFIFRRDERIAVGETISFTTGGTRVQDALIQKIQ